MVYGKFKQGTIIHGLRSEQYRGAPCSAVIITAECDIAQCKVSKFYYLTAMDVRTWMKTEGLAYTAAQAQLSELKSVINDYGKNVPGLSEYKNAAIVDLDGIIEDLSTLSTDKTAQKALQRLKGAKKEYDLSIKTDREVEALFAKLENKIIGNIKSVIDGSLIQYFFLPRISYADPSEQKPDDAKDGLIVNFQDIGFFDRHTVSMIEQQKMDYDKLSEEERTKYGKIFFLEKPNDMIFPEEFIHPPYREWLMQSFSFAFIRIGVEFDKSAAKTYWENELKEPAQ
ncbi:hypothetical protein [uncultured Oscillibacter sp.]|uniref:hypothetical protein n=1 Tax=uncultured Oscillibacter sp. TaxID=876091 RepID=UPI0025CCFEB8|nr:hypothetical protein [uncultured Oscillibacter sp.]